MLFRSGILIGYDFDSEEEDFEEMVNNGTLVFDETIMKYVLAESENQSSEQQSWE